MKHEAKRVSRSGLLLTETLIAILFFSIASAICLQLFVKTHQLERKTQALDLAVTQAVSVDAVLTRVGAKDTDFDAVANGLSDYYQFSGEQLSDGIIHIFFNRNYTNCAQENAVYDLRLSLGDGWTSEPEAKDTPVLLFSDIVMLDLTSGDEILYELTVSTYHPAGREVSAP